MGNPLDVVIGRCGLLNTGRGAGERGKGWVSENTGLINGWYGKGGLKVFWMGALSRAFRGLAAFGASALC